MERMGSKLEIPTPVKFNTVSFKPIEHRLICKSNIQFVQIHFQPKQNQFWSRICIHIVVEPKGNWFLSLAIFQSVDDAPYNLVLLASYWSQYLQTAFYVDTTVKEIMWWDQQLWPSPCCIFRSDNKLQLYFRYLSYWVISPCKYLLWFKRGFLEMTNPLGFLFKSRLVSVLTKI